MKYQIQNLTMKLTKKQQIQSFIQMYFCTFHYNNLTAKSMQSDNYFVTKTQPQKVHVPLYVYKLEKYPVVLLHF